MKDLLYRIVDVCEQSQKVLDSAGFGLSNLLKDITDRSLNISNLCSVSGLICLKQPKLNSNLDALGFGVSGLVDVANLIRERPGFCWYIPSYHTGMHINLLELQLKLDLFNNNLLIRFRCTFLVRLFVHLYISWGEK